MQVAVTSPSLTATLLAPADVGGLGARVEVPFTRAIVSAWHAAAWDPVSGVWSVTLDTPPAQGEFNLVWRTGDPEPPAYEAFIPLSVIATLTVAEADAAAWRPTTAEVALVTPAYTRGGFDDDSPQAGAELGVYDATTSPTGAHVQGLIDAAVDEVQGRVGAPILLPLAALAKRTAVWHVAAAIAAGKAPAATDDATGEYRAFVTNYRACLDELAAQARGAGFTRLA